MLMHLKKDYGTFGLWGAILAGGETVVSKRTFRCTRILIIINKKRKNLIINI